MFPWFDIHARRASIRCVCALTLVSLATIFTVAAKAADTRITVFELGDGNGSQFGYRIPALAVTKGGALLAFSERRDGLHDHAENDIVLRRSRDGGRSCEPLQVVAEEGGDSLNDPCAIVLDSGRILLRYTRFPRGVHARVSDHTVMATAGYVGPKTVRIYLTHSDDDGETWATPRDVTRSMRRAPTNSLGSPGVGLQLTRGAHAGRIVFPNYEVYPLGGDKRTTLNSVSYSDDGGETWQLSATMKTQPDEGTGNEAQIAELSDGGLLMTSRRFPEFNGRLISTSHDGGETWSTQYVADDLLTPACMASLIRYSWPDSPQGSVLLQSLPHTEDSRSNGTLMVSRDEGETWRVGCVIDPADFAYSCLARLPDGDVACLYETEDYGKVVFARFSPAAFLEESQR